jgi:hypothetical protein
MSSRRSRSRRVSDERIAIEVVALRDRVLGTMTDDPDQTASGDYIGAGRRVRPSRELVGWQGAHVRGPV